MIAILLLNISRTIAKPLAKRIFKFKLGLTFKNKTHFLVKIIIIKSYFKTNEVKNMGGGRANWKSK